MPSKPTSGVKSKSRARNRVRIVGGAWRSRLIEFPDTPGLRPTPDRVRETLFNWLGQTLHDKRCLDLFAGSGALGFEAASRGAAEVFMIENDRDAHASLADNRSKLDAVSCRIVRADALAWLAGAPGGFDIAFVDPPFASGLLPRVLPLLQDKMNPGGLIYVEWGEPPAGLLNAPGLTLGVVKEGRAGMAFFALLSAQQTPAGPPASSPS